MTSYFESAAGYRFSHLHQFSHLGLKVLADQLVFIRDETARPYDGIESLVKLIRQARKETGKLPVICLDMNPCHCDSWIEELLQHLDSKEFFVFYPDLRPEFSRWNNVAPWPMWLIIQQLELNYWGNKPRQHRISMLSGSMRYHRLLLYRAVKPEIKSNDVVVINRIGDFARSVPYDCLTPTEIHQWEQELPYASREEFFDYPVKGPVTSWNCVPNCGENTHTAFSAMVNITNETVDNSQCLLSEKTWKAYKSGCLVVNYGVTGACDFLKHQGFWIWDEYDTSDHYSQRTKKLTELFARDDIAQVYSQYQDNIAHNQQLVTSIDFAKKLAQPAVQKLNNML
jgi:hypothetical protein